MEQEDIRLEQPFKDAVFQFSPDAQYLVLSNSYGTVCFSVQELRAIQEWDSLPSFINSTLLQSGA
ncbi:MAG: hypothetical protein U0936_18375 [Planctomycetaceae bacterium]